MEKRKQVKEQIGKILRRLILIKQVPMRLRQHIFRAVPDTDLSPFDHDGPVYGCHNE